MPGSAIQSSIHVPCVLGAAAPTVITSQALHIVARLALWRGGRGGAGEKCAQGAFRRWLRNLQRAADQPSKSNRHAEEDVVQALVSVVVARHAIPFIGPCICGVSEGEHYPAASLEIPALANERGAAQWRVRAASHTGPAPPHRREGLPSCRGCAPGDPRGSKRRPGPSAAQWRCNGRREGRYARTKLSPAAGRSSIATHTWRARGRA